MNMPQGCGVVRNKAITMIGIAAVFGAVSIFAADFWLKSQENTRIETRTVEVQAPAQPKVEFKTIVVASQPLAFGTTLERTQLTQIPWPQDSLPQGAFETIDAAFAEGARVILSPIEPNEPVLLSKLSGPNGRASLSNLLTPGMRAVAIKTDEVAGVGGFITPGDRVDVVLTRDAGEIDETRKSATGAAGSTIATEIVVESARVLSVGQGADERQTGPQVANSVTVEVNPDGAAKIALARNIGTLSLQLRAAGEGATSGNGLTTISAFGGSLTEAFSEASGAVVEAVAKEPEKPKFKIVVVTRGVDAAQTYEVPEASTATAGLETSNPVPVSAEQKSDVPQAPAVVNRLLAKPTDGYQGGLELPDTTAAVPSVRGVEQKAASADQQKPVRPRRADPSPSDYYKSTPGLY